MGAVKLSFFLKDFQDDGSTAQGNQKTYEYGFIEGTAQFSCNDEAETKGKQHLKRATDNHRPLHADELFQGEFDPNSKEE